MSFLSVANIVLPGVQHLPGLASFISAPNSFTGAGDFATGLSIVPGQPGDGAYMSAFIREQPRELPAALATMPSVITFESRHGRIDLSLSPVQADQLRPELQAETEAIFAYMIRMFHGPKPAIYRSRVVDAALLASRMDALGDRYDGATEKEKGAWVEERIQGMMRVWGSDRFAGFLGDGLHLTDEGRRFAAEHLEELCRALPCRDLLECILLFPYAATAGDLDRLFETIERHLRANGQFDVDRDARAVIDQKMEKIVLGFLDFVHSECRVIENAYRYERGAFTARASWFLYRTAEKAGFLLSAHPTAIDGGISAMPFTQEQLLGEIRDVRVRHQGHAWLRGNDAVAIDWVARQAMSIVSGSDDIIACYRNGFFTGTFRSLLLSLIRAYEEKMKR